MKILVLNCGSSSLKYQLIDMADESVLAKGLCERIAIEGSRMEHKPAGKDKYIIERPMKDHSVAIQMVLEALTDAEHGVLGSIGEVGAVGHRVVHGGEAFHSSVIITDEVMRAIKACCELAPLHNPPNLLGIEATEKLLPGVPMVAVFDTAFHQTMPEKAYLYAIPLKYYDEYKVRKYGFHGTSHKYVGLRAAEMLGKPASALKIITCHLGNGCSVAAINGGKSVDTSMGFTPLEGLAMGTRSGDIDPSVVLFISERENMTAKDAAEILNKKSGVLGISGISSDFRDLEAARDQGDKNAACALSLFSYRTAKYIGAYAAAMNGADAIVFTAGVGENGPGTRSAVCAYLGYLGVALDEEKNAVRGREIDIATPESKVRVLVIPTNEELVIARDTNELVK